MDDLTDQKFGKLLVLRQEEPRWVCRCDCGNIAVRRADLLLSGKSKACGECTENGRRPKLTKEQLRARRAEVSERVVTRTCQHCGKEFEGSVWACYCSAKCRKAVQKQQKKAHRERQKNG